MRVAAIAAAASAIACAAAFAQESTESTATLVYESVAPAVVFVETDGGSGSGLLLASDAVLTAAHVVYPHRSARVVFPSGTQMLDVPVIGWDLMADVAVLGPISDATPEPPQFGFPDGLPVGADLYVIGYPGEEEPFPQPAISRTVLSRYRRWPGQRATYLQTDEALDGGHSGGVLVSAAGEVVGMTLYSYGHFGLALSIADAMPRASALLAGEDPGRLGDREWRGASQATPIRFELATLWTVQAFVIAARPGDEVAFSAFGRIVDLGLRVVDATGVVLADADERLWRRESVAATLDGAPPFLLLVDQFNDRAVRVRVKGDVPLVPLADEDDGTALHVHARHAGAIDHPYDVDTYRLPLRAGDTVRVRVDSVLIDPYLRIDYRRSSDVAEDDDSGGGLFGLNAELTYHAEEDRVYRIVVDDPTGQYGGYTLTVRRDAGRG